jgi:hypothetical protein
MIRFVPRLLAALLPALTFSICSANAATLTTAVTTNGGCEGIFVDITAKSQPVSVTGIESVVVGTDNVSVFYKAGSYSGFEQTAGAWTLLNSAPVTGGSGAIQALYPVSVGAGVTIPAGQTFGFLIWIDNAAGSLVKAIRYDTSGVTDTTDDALITIYSGMSSCGGATNDPFDGTSNIRAWRGSVTYNLAMQSIPTLSEYGLIVLTALLALSTAFTLRKRTM